MDNGNEQAFPASWGDAPPDLGLTKREHFAALAMQGLCGNSALREDLDIVGMSVRLADELLAELDKEES